MLPRAREPGCHAKLVDGSACAGWHRARRFRSGTGAVRLPAPLVQIAKNLQQTFSGRDAAPLTIHHQNEHGRFVFRAHWLDPVEADASTHIGITVQHQKAIVLVSVRNMQRLGLSDGQQKVCLWLAETASPDVVAQRLGVTKTTVKDHVKKICEKVGVHSRDDLMRELGLAGRIAAA